MHVDMADRVEIGPMVDGSYCWVAPSSEPCVTRGPLIPDKLDVWYIAVMGVGSRGRFQGTVGWYPVRQFLDKADAMALHNMLLKGEVEWHEAVEVPIADGKRRLINHAIPLVGSNVPTVADLHQGRRGLR